MQVPDGWCGGDMPLTGNHPASWEEEEDVEIGVWNSNSVQDAGVPLHWPPCSKKMPSKVNMPGGRRSCLWPSKAVGERSTDFDLPPPVRNR